MKIKSLFIATLYSVVTVFALSYCSSKKEEAAQEETHDESMHASSDKTTALAASAPQFEVDAKFQQQLSGVFTSYVSLKDAFVATDAGKVKEAAAKTQESLSKVDMMLLTGVAHNDWMTFEGGLKAALKEMQASADIEAQRASFSKLSDNMYKSIKAYGLGGATAYYEFCPMAFNNQGGYWLSDASEIRNPYFGDKMLKCGTVEEKLN
jgi:Cu(I)/Ag(I) efflux system membrane fusion protein